MTECKGHIFNIQRMSVHDGPGIRTVVFLKGCPLNCLWCHNPEGIHRTVEISYNIKLCMFCGRCVAACENEAIAVSGNLQHDLNRERCQKCGQCVEVCPAGALEKIGRDVSADEVMAEVIRDRVYYEESDGGMTISGGEPLLQPAFSLQLLKAAKAAGINTCLETCGFGETNALISLASFSDLVLFDIKETDPELHEQWTGVSNTFIRNNLKILDQQQVPIILRCPIVPGLNLRDDHIQGIAETAATIKNCSEIHLMTFHKFGLTKQQALGRTIPKTLDDIEPASPEEMQQICEMIKTLWDGNVEIY